MRYKGLYERKFARHECLMLSLDYAADGSIVMTFDGLPARVLDDLGNAMAYADYCEGYRVDGDMLVLEEPSYGLTDEMDYREAVREYLNELNFDLLFKTE